VNFITGAGGFLQTMINGYPGFRITDNGLLFNPRCPEGATYIKMRQLNYLNVHFNVFFSCETSEDKTVASELIVEALEDSGLALHLVKNGSHSKLAVLANKLFKGKAIQIDLSEMRSKFGSTHFRLIEELF
jgi:trehalose/maltose hydrolase-like predicted phosphorylase